MGQEEDSLIDALLPLTAIALVGAVFLLRRRKRTTGCPRCE
jgi:hypothetical protein